MKYKGEKNGTIETLIGIDVHIIGDLNSERDLRIEGIIDGNITSKSSVIIGAKAHVIGNVEAKSVIVYGKVEGNIHVIEQLEIMETGEFYGELTTQKLYVALGGIISGVSKMKKQEALKKQSEKS